MPPSIGVTERPPSAPDRTRIRCANARLQGSLQGSEPTLAQHSSLFSGGSSNGNTIASRTPRLVRPNCAPNVAAGWAADGVSDPSSGRAADTSGSQRADARRVRARPAAVHDADAGRHRIRVPVQLDPGGAVRRPERGVDRRGDRGCPRRPRASCRSRTAPSSRRSNATSPRPRTGLRSARSTSPGSRPPAHRRAQARRPRRPIPGQGRPTATIPTGRRGRSRTAPLRRTTIRPSPGATSSSRPPRAVRRLPGSTTSAVRTSSRSRSRTPTLFKTPLGSFVKPSGGASLTFSRSNTVRMEPIL